MIKLLIFILLTSGAYQLVCELAGLPPSSTAKGVRYAVSKKKSMYDSLNAYFIMPFVKVIAPFINMVDYKEKRMKEQLARAIGTDVAVAISVNDEGLAKAIETKIADLVMERKG